jgi:hypothetical protein
VEAVGGFEESDVLEAAREEANRMTNRIAETDRFLCGFTPPF